MSTLGSIFASSDPRGAPAGPDLLHTVQVPPAALGHPDGVWVEIPLQISTPDGQVARVLLDPDDGAWVPLRLPEGFPDGGRVRLRGQGGRRDGGPAGNLVLTVEVREDAPLMLAPAGVAVTTPRGALPFLVLGSVGLVLALLMLRVCS